MVIKDIIDNISNSKIQNSKIHGNGLFATCDMPSEVIIGILDGQQIPYSLYRKLNLSLEWNALENDILLVRPYRTKYSFINHSRKPNVRIDNAPLRVVTIKNIKKGQEIVIDYRKEPLPLEYIKNHGKTYL